MDSSTIWVDGVPIPVYGETQVLVVGGGVAGIGAALAAARNGKKVTLLEKSCVLGGLATLGHVCVYLPLDDGVGNKVFGGIAEELLHTTIRYGYNTLAPGWERGVMRLENPQGRYRTHFNIPACVLAFDELMEQEGIQVIFDVVFSQPIMEGRRCRGVVMESKQGRVAYLAEMVVDASGDADVMHRAGAACEEKTNIVSYWCYEQDFASLRRGLENEDILQAFSLRWLGLRPDMDNTNSGITEFAGTTIDGVNGHIKLSRKIALDYLKKTRRPDYTMLTMPFMPQFRMTRRISGMAELDMEHPDTYREDSVGCVCYSLAQPAPVYEFPYGAILDKNLENIAAAGRIVAARDQGWDLMRLIPACVFSGQVAGTAAAIALDQGAALQEVALHTLQDSLEKTGVIIHVPDYMKGNVNKRFTTNPKDSKDTLIKADALSYH